MTNSDDLLLVQQISGAPLKVGEDLRAVLLQFSARRNHSTEETQHAYVLRLDDVVQLLTGLMSASNVAFGRNNVQRAMAEFLEIPAAKSERAVRVVNDVLDRELR